MSDYQIILLFLSVWIIVCFVGWAICYGGNKRKKGLENDDNCLNKQLIIAKQNNDVAKQIELIKELIRR